MKPSVYWGEFISYLSEMTDAKSFKVVQNPALDILEYQKQPMFWDNYDISKKLTTFKTEEETKQVSWHVFQISESPKQSKEKVCQYPLI